MYHKHLKLFSTAQYYARAVIPEHINLSPPAFKVIQDQDKKIEILRGSM